MGKKVQMKFHKKKSPITTMLVILGIIFIFFFIIIFFFRITTLDIEEGKYYTKDELKQYIMTETSDNNTIMLYLKLKQDKIDIPYIQKIEVDYINHNTLKIHVYEKDIVGCFSYMNQYVYFDKDGKVLDISNEKLDDIPIIEGVRFKEIDLYNKISVDNDVIFDKITSITKLIKKYKVQIDKVTFDIYNNITLSTNDIRIYLGKRESHEDQLAALSNLLPKLSGHKGELDMVNYEDGQSQLIFKEEK